MALVVGELTAYLNVNKDAYTAGIRDAKGDMQGLQRDAKVSADGVGTSTERMVRAVAESTTRLTRDAQGKLRNARGQFASDAEKLAAGFGDEMGKGGEKAGGLLAQGIRSGFIRRSPLIVAAVAGALTAGAPLAIAGATTLFGGIAGVASSQYVEVRSSWSSLGQEIRNGVVADARSTIPAITGMADDLGESFQRLRPQLQDAFTAAGPQIETFTRGITSLAENAMPGLLRAVQASGPVMDGFASFLAATGTGLTGFFDAMSTHAPAAGAAFTALGDIMGALLPILGELLGQGAELAAIVLPPLASVLGVVADALGAVGPLLPAITAGFTAMKVASAVGAGVGTLADKLRGLADGGSVAQGAMSKLGSILTPTNVAVGALAIGVGIAMAAIQDSDRQVQDWAAALREGGTAARLATEEMSAHDAKIRELSSGVKGAAIEVSGMSGYLGIFAEDANEARQATEDWYNALTPQARAAQDVKTATADLADAVDRYGASSPQAESASRALTAAQQEQERANSELEQAISGVTSAMIEQANQAMAAADSSIGYRQAQQTLQEQMIATESIMSDSESTALDMSGAMLDLEKDTLAVATAAGQLAADALPAATSELEREQVAASAMLTELVNLRTEMGDKFPPALNNTIAGLQASGATIDGVSAQSSNATGMVRNFIGSLTDLGQQRPVPVADLDSSPLQDSYDSSLNVLGILSGQRPLPIADLFSGPLNTSWSGAMNLLGNLAGQRPSPVATLFANTGNAEAQLNWAARNRTSTVYQNVVQNVSRFISGFAATGGLIRDIQRVGFSNGGKLSGPGTPTSDSIPVRTLSGRQLAFSDEEWVINALQSRRQGDYRMAALNAGKADIVLHSERRVRGLAGGGPIGGTVSAPSKAGTVIHVGGVTVKVDTPLNLMSDRDLRRAGEKIREVVIDLDRAQS